jgi:hypothetical protein
MMSNVQLPMLKLNVNLPAGSWQTARARSSAIWAWVCYAGSFILNVDIEAAGYSTKVKVHCKGKFSGPTPTPTQIKINSAVS